MKNKDKSCNSVLLSGNINSATRTKQYFICATSFASLYTVFQGKWELHHAKDQGVATMIERDGVIRGYAADIGILGHAVAKSNEDLKTLIANASTILGPGFFVPARNHEVINWLLESGFQIGWPANLMTVGPYQEPLMPFLSFLAY